MPEARHIGMWFAILGIALMLQGCWENEQDRFALVGDGGCRTADDRHGSQTTVTEITLAECRERCLEVNGACSAIEYTSSGGVCEIHSEPITKFESAEGVTCYVTK
jgi:PAN domain